MRFLLSATDHSHKSALVASVNYGWALVLVSKKLLVRYHLLASLVSVAASEHEFAEKIPCHSIYPIKLTFVSTEWAGVRVLLKPVGFAVTTQGLFTNNTFDWVLQNIIADTTDELG